jgi:hypothetical protein
MWTLTRSEYRLMYPTLTSNGERGQLGLRRHFQRILESLLCFGWLVLGPLVSVLGALACCGPLVSLAAETLSPEANVAVRRAVAALDMQANPNYGTKSLIAYTLVKAGVGPNDPRVSKRVAAVQLSCGSGEYGHPGRNSLQVGYDAAVDIMLLEAVDPVQYQPQITTIANFIMSSQRENGSWNYPTDGPTEQGDTSVTQYSLLGLWAASRAGVAIPAEVWGKAAEWHIKNQNSDGGFAYRVSTKKVSTMGMTLAGAFNLRLIRLILYPGAAQASAERRLEPVKKGTPSVLERLPNERGGPVVAGPKTTVNLGALDSAIRKSKDFIERSFTVKLAPPDRGPHAIYSMYSLERYGALSQDEVINGEDWYLTGTSLMVNSQGLNGTWKGNFEAEYGQAETCLAVLFLVRPTKQLVSPQLPRIGGGLLAGGRGLTPVAEAPAQSKQPKSDFALLLEKLEQPQEVNIPQVQAAIVESVQLGNRAALITQRERLISLVNHPSDEVRRTVYWALGRTDDVRIAPLLIAGLRDANRDAALEASLSLCVLARKPSGPEGPTGLAYSIVPPEGTDEEGLKRWAADLQAGWKVWYLEVRPYDERDDRDELPSAR